MPVGYFSRRASSDIVRCMTSPHVSSGPSECTFPCWRVGSAKLKTVIRACTGGQLDDWPQKSNLHGSTITPTLGTVCSSHAGNVANPARGVVARWSSVSLSTPSIDSSSCSIRLSGLRDGPRLPARGGLAMLGSQRSAYRSSTWASAMMKYLTQEHSPSTSSPILHRCKSRAATRIQLWGRLQKLDRTHGAASTQPDVSFCRHNGSESASGCCRSFVAVCLHRGTDFPTSGRMPDIRMCVPSGSV